MELLKSAEIDCPYCGDPMTVALDCSVEFQQYIEDCQVCCRPIVFTVQVDAEYDVTVSVHHEDEA